MRTPQAQYDRDRTALKHYLIGRDYSEALGALGLAERWHVGLRKDGVTPELHHQIGVCFNFLNTPIKNLQPNMEEAALGALLGHDLVEDYPVTDSELRSTFRPFTRTLIQGMTKVKGETLDQFFERHLRHWLLPILKACDRDNNVMTMQGAFTIQKMKAYIRETRTHILALLKKASNIFPQHHRSYSALATGIKKQLRIYEGFIAAQEAFDEQHAVVLKEHACMREQLQAAKRQLSQVDELIAVNAQLRQKIIALSSPQPTLMTAANENAETFDRLSTTVFIRD